MSTVFDIAHTAGRVYAEALWALASQRNVVDEVESQMNDLAALWRSERSFAAMMESAAIDDDARRASLRKIFTGRVDELVLNLMLVMNDKGRSMLFAHVCEAFARLVDEKRNRRRVFLSSAVPLSDAQRARAAAEAKRLSGREPILVERTDPSLLAGLVLQVGDRVVDTSLRRRLHRMREEIRFHMDRRLHDGKHEFVRDS